MIRAVPAWQRLDTPAWALGESPFWHPDEQRLYWVDILGKKVLRISLGAGPVEQWDMPTEPGCIAPARGGGLVLALRHGIFRARSWGGTLEKLATLPYDTATVRANDGKCDAQGRFWVGTLDETKARHAAALFSLEAQAGSALAPLHLACKVVDATTGNGLAWSPSGTTLYWADTAAHCVHAWDFDGSDNSLLAHRVHLRFDAKPAGWIPGAPGYGGRPDGAAVDVKGNYWLAMYEGRRIACFAPDGTLLRELLTPVQCPTMPCFGGPDLKTLYITTARQGRSAGELAAMPHSGSVFCLPVEVPGLPVNFFAD